MSAVLLYIYGREEKGAVNNAIPLLLFNPLILTTYFLTLLLDSQN